MTKRIAALAAILALGVAAPAASAFAYEARVPVQRFVPVAPFDGAAAFSTDRAYDAAAYGRCLPSSASEGNANQQNFPVKQYGQTSGGSAC